MRWMAASSRSGCTCLLYTSRERATQQERQAREREQAEHQRIERMNSTELAHEIGRIRPPKALDLVERDRGVLQAEQELSLIHI